MSAAEDGQANGKTTVAAGRQHTMLASGAGRALRRDKRAHRGKRKGAFLKMGTLSPNPWDLAHWAIPGMEEGT